MKLTYIQLDRLTSTYVIKTKLMLFQRRGCCQFMVEPSLSLPNDKLQLFVFAWAIFYVLVHLVTECLMNQESTQESMELEKYIRPNKFGFFTSTPMQSMYSIIVNLTIIGFI